MPSVAAPAVAKAGYMLSSMANNSFIVVNDLFQAGAEVSRTTAATGSFPAEHFTCPIRQKLKPF